MYLASQVAKLMILRVKGRVDIGSIKPPSLSAILAILLLYINRHAISCLQVVHMDLFVVERYRILLCVDRVPPTRLHNWEVDFIGVASLTSRRIDTIQLEGRERNLIGTVSILAYDRLKICSVDGLRVFLLDQLFVCGDHGGCIS